MATFNIYNKNDLLRTTLHASDNSTHQIAIQEESTLSLSMTSQECVRLEPGDYVDFMDSRFWLLEGYTPKQSSTVEWNYDVKFTGVEGIAKQALMLNSEGVPLEAYHGPAREQLAMVVMNLNRWMNTTDWKVGDCVATENLDIDYSGGTYCNEALGKIAEAAGVEWWMEGTTVNLTRCEHGELIELSYNNGLLSIERDNADNVPFFTRLFPVGSSRNVEYGSYGHSRLQLPNGMKYVERNAGKYGVVERYEENAFSHIFPRRTGYVSSVRTEQATGNDGNPFTIYYFKDTGLNFDPNSYEIGGLVKHIIFQDGDLAGRDFEVNYNSNTKEFEIITQWPYDNDVQIPGGLLIPKAGNAYILYNIKMPSEYYPMAEQEFADAVANFINEHSGMTDRSVYKCPTNYIILDFREINLKIGQRVKLLSDRFFPEAGYVESRITRITRNVNRPNQADIEISDVLSKTTQSSMQDSIAAVRHEFKTATTTFPDIIRSWESTKPTDTNLYSARKSEREFLSKRNNDTAAGLIRFLKGINIGDFETGMLGSGAAITADEDGITTAEVDKLIVRRYAKFFELIIERLSHIGGQLIVSPARMECNRVEELPNAYRCYFDTGDNGEFVQEFVVGDQARCQVFTGSMLKYYWRLVTGIGSDYIDLSKTDCDSGSDVPSAGDHVVQLGNRNNPERQNAQILSSFGEDAPSYKQYAGIDSYSLTGKYVTGFTGKGNKITGLVNIEPGSTGWQHLTGLPEEIQKAADIDVGAVNLVMNTAFEGDFESRKLNANTPLNADSELFSKSLIHWEGNAEVIKDAESITGYACRVYTDLSQILYRPLIDDERYVLSFRAKGNMTVKIGTFSNIPDLSSGNYEKVILRFEALNAAKLEFKGDFTICEIQLERGTVATEWSPSPRDNDRTLAEFEAIRYMSDAIKGKTSILGGLILTSMIQLGIFRNGELEEITAGISGIYNDDDDVAFWAGGKLEDAIRAVISQDNQGANAVITHGGKAILNEAIVRGVIYAIDGIFKGKVYAEDGEFTGKITAKSGTIGGFSIDDEKLQSLAKTNDIANIILSGLTGAASFAKGNAKFNEDGTVEITGKFESSKSGNRIIVDPETKSIKFINNKNQVVTEFGFYDADYDVSFGYVDFYNYAGNNLTGKSRIVGGYLYIYDGNGNLNIMMGTDGLGRTNIQFQNLPTSASGLGSGRMYRSGSDLRIA